jgi:CHAT domain-containing protein
MEESWRLRARLALAAGDLETAQQASDTAVTLARQIDDADAGGRATELRGRVLEARGLPDEAEVAYREAIAHRQQVTAKLTEEERRFSLPRWRSRPYRRLACSRLRQPENASAQAVGEALTLLDESRARTLLEILTRARVSRPAIEHSAESGGATGDNEPLELALTEIEKGLDRARSGGEGQWHWKRRFGGTGGSTRRLIDARSTIPPGLDMDVLGSALAEERAALVAFVLGPEDAWALLATGDRLAAFPLGASERIVRLAARVEPLLSATEASAPDPMPALSRLGDLLIAPWIDQLQPDTERLLIVPDGVLERLPFEALRLPDSPEDPRRYLLERFVVAYLPSASSWLALRSRPVEIGPHGPLLVVANPQYDARSVELASTFRAGRELPALPASQKEAAALMRMAPRGSKLLMNEAATERNLKDQDLDRFALVHLAVHAIADVAYPLRSGLLLSPGDEGQDGLVQMRELLDMPLRAQLVVLSACESGVGPVDREEGIASLPFAFLQAGARGVIATMWSVDDRATAAFMERFYDAVAEGRLPVEALRLAKLKTITAAGSPSAHPAAWAPFVFIGDPAARIELSGGLDLGRWSWLIVGVVIAASAFALRRWIAARRQAGPDV